MAASFVERLKMRGGVCILTERDVSFKLRPELGKFSEQIFECCSVQTDRFNLIVICM